ncbi:unnamed protein product [Euphydryas editha]|uniref:UBR-type domain-containing protein n=1 Tax=Euphydryas editha TaxID=104508 RepID=A0AAU9VD49_EUPED|nr:unnamed protein product [Euphydryas editha]
MASDIKTTSEDTDMSECDGENVVTMMDVLQDQADFEEDANAVLGASDENNCTYSKGYIKRQAIYACLTCCSEAKSDPSQRAGVCLACSLICHENHELVELYTKRNFRCDCGNPKFKSHPCTFTPNKADLNEDNYYNQNFSGLYCICQRPYPDPETTVEDVMIQCIICEDWLHGSHLEAPVPGNDQYSEMICKTCMEKNAFLHDYSELAVNIDSIDVDVVNINGVDNNTKLINGDAKTESNNSSSNESVTNTDVEMTEEKLEASVNTTDTRLESNDGNPPSPVTKTESVVKEKIPSQDEKNDESMETNQIESSDAASEESPASVAQKQSNEESEQKAITDSEMKDNEKTDDIPTDILDEPIKDKTENNCDKTTEENGSDQSENIDNSEEQQSSKESNNKLDENNQKDDLETSKTDAEQKANEENAEKMAEDRLLADPEDDPKKSDVVENNIDCTEQATTSNDTNCIKNDTVITSDDSNIISNETNVTNNDTNITSDETNATSNDTNITSDDKNITTNDTNFTSNDADITTNDKNVTSNETIVTSNDTNITNNDTNIASNDENITSNDTVPHDKEETKSEGDADSGVDEKLDTSEDKVNIEETSNQSVKQNAHNIDTTNTNAEGTSTNNVNDEDSNEKKIASENIPEDKNTPESQNENTIEVAPSSAEKISEKRKHVEEHSENAKKLKLENKACVRPKGVKKIYKGATFWPSHFRQSLCSCQECITMYKDLSVLFLIDPEDTVTAYENLGKEKINGKPATQYERGMQALSSLGRIQQINALTEYNKMRDKLLDFLKSFKDRKEIVKEEDIKAFFAEMKPKREPDGVYFCR